MRPLAWLIPIVATSIALAQPTANNAQGGTPHFWPADATPPRGHDVVPPFELAGFRFGLSKEAARAACHRARHRWTQHGDRWHCDGVVRDISFPAEVHLRFCNGRLCEISARLNGRADPGRVDSGLSLWAQTHRRLLAALRGAFGAEVSGQVRAPEPCADSLRAGRSADCFTRAENRARHFWDASGFELELALQPASPTPELTVTFRGPRRVQELSATSD